MNSWLIGFSLVKLHRPLILIVVLGAEVCVKKVIELEFLEAPPFILDKNSSPHDLPLLLSNRRVELFDCRVLSLLRNTKLHATSTVLTLLKLAKVSCFECQLAFINCVLVVEELEATTERQLRPWVDLAPVECQWLLRVLASVLACVHLLNTPKYLLVSQVNHIN